MLTRRPYRRQHTPHKKRNQVRERTTDMANTRGRCPRLARKIRRRPIDRLHRRGSSARAAKERRDSCPRPRIDLPGGYNPFERYSTPEPPRFNPGLPKRSAPSQAYKPHKAVRRLGKPLLIFQVKQAEKTAVAAPAPEETQPALPIDMESSAPMCAVRPEIHNNDIKGRPSHNRPTPSTPKFCSRHTSHPLSRQKTPRNRCFSRKRSHSTTRSRQRSKKCSRSCEARIRD